MDDPETLGFHQKRRRNPPERPASKERMNPTAETLLMKAIAVTPGKPNSVHLATLARPSLSDVADGRGVLVKVLRVGVDGTDREINAAEYGAAPLGTTS